MLTLSHRGPYSLITQSKAKLVADQPNYQDHEQPWLAIVANKPTL